MVTFQYWVEVKRPLWFGGKKSDFMLVLGNSHTSEYFRTSETPAGFSPFSCCVPICHEHLHIDCIRLAEPQKFLKSDFCFRSIWRIWTALPSTHLNSLFCWSSGLTWAFSLERVGSSLAQTAEFWLSPCGVLPSAACRPGVESSWKWD